MICASLLAGAEAPCAIRRVLLRLPEDQIVEALNEAVAAHAGVSFGSYPVSQGLVSTILTLEAAADEEEVLEGALRSLLAALPADAVAEVSSTGDLAAPGAIQSLPLTRSVSAPPGPGPR